MSLVPLISSLFFLILPWKWISVIQLLWFSHRLILSQCLILLKFNGIRLLLLVSASSTLLDPLSFKLLSGQQSHLINVLLLASEYTLYSTHHAFKDALALFLRSLLRIGIGMFFFLFLTLLVAAVKFIVCELFRHIGWVSEGFGGSRSLLFGLFISGVEEILRV